MSGERETAVEMFARHDEECRQFFIGQARRLIRVGFRWEISEDFAQKQNYRERGLVINDRSNQEYVGDRLSRVLTPEGVLILVLPNGEAMPINPGMDLPLAFYNEVEEKVAQTLVELQTVKA